MFCDVRAYGGVDIAIVADAAAAAAASRHAIP